MAHNRWEPQLAPGAMFRVKQRCTPSIPQTGNIQQTHLGNKDKPSREGTRVSLKHIFSMKGLLMWHFKRTQREGDTWSSLGGVSRCDKLCNSLCADVIVFHYSRYYKHQTHNDTHSHHLLSLMGSLVPSLTVIIFKIKRSWINAMTYNASPNNRDGPG